MSKSSKKKDVNNDFECCESLLKNAYKQFNLCHPGSACLLLEDLIIDLTALHRLILTHKDSYVISEDNEYE